MKKLQTDISKARKELNLTQKQLAQALDITENYVYMLEAGKKPLSKKLAARLDALKNHPEKTASKTEKSHLTAEEAPAVYRASSELAMLRTQLQQAHAREKIHLDIIKNLTANTKQP